MAKVTPISELIEAKGDFIPITPQRLCDRFWLVGIFPNKTDYALSRGPDQEAEVSLNQALRFGGPQAYGIDFEKLDRMADEALLQCGDRTRNDIGES